MVAALEGRRYNNQTGQQLVLTFELEDDPELCPWNSGRYELCVAVDGAARVTQHPPAPSTGKVGSGSSAELRMGIGALTLLWAGSSTATELAMAGLVSAIGKYERRTRSHDG